MQVPGPSASGLRGPSRHPGHLAVPSRPGHVTVVLRPPTPASELRSTVGSIHVELVPCVLGVAAGWQLSVSSLE